jgi:putative oxidoreductase
MKNVTLSGEMPKRNVVGRFVEMNRSKIVEVISALFILLFVYTAISKIREYYTLELILKDYPLIGAFSSVISWALPATELIVALLLFIPRTKLLGLYCSAILMSLFTIYLGYILTFESKKPCTCGGMLQELSWPQHLIFNSLFILFAIWGIKLLKNKSPKNTTE